MQGHYREMLQIHYNNMREGMNMDKELARLVVVLDSLDVLITNETLAYGPGTVKPR